MQRCFRYKQRCCYLFIYLNYISNDDIDTCNDFVDISNDVVDISNWNSSQYNIQIYAMKCESAESRPENLNHPAMQAIAEQQSNTISE